MRAWECIEQFITHRPATIIVEDNAIEAQFFDALSFYLGYEELESHRILRECAELDYMEFQQPDIRAVCAWPTDINPDTGEILAKEDRHCTCISYSEWALIRPLFELYVERANAVFLESSRLYGVDVFGRSVAEVQTDITQMENEFAHKSFRQEMVSV